MVKFTFYVHCDGWAAGGYENAHSAETEKEARSIIKTWNAEADARRARTIAELTESNPYGIRIPSAVDGKVDLIRIERVTDEEFAEDYIPAFL